MFPKLLHCFLGAAPRGRSPLPLKDLSRGNAVMRQLTEVPILVNKDTLYITQTILAE